MREHRCLNGAVDRPSIQVRQSRIARCCDDGDIAKPFQAGEGRGVFVGVREHDAFAGTKARHHAHNMEPHAAVVEKRPRRVGEVVAAV